MKNELKDAASQDLKLVSRIIEDIKVCMITTIDAHNGLCSRPMTTLEIDKEGAIWFFTSSNAKIMADIKFQPRVHVTFASSSKNEYLASRAIATEVIDQEKMKELWTPSMKIWFKDGLKTEDLVLLKLQLEDVDYWDAPSTAVVKITGFMKDLISNEPYRPGRHEQVNLNL